MSGLLDCDANSLALALHASSVHVTCPPAQHLLPFCFFLILTCNYSSKSAVCDVKRISCATENVQQSVSFQTSLFELLLTLSDACLAMLVVIEDINVQLQHSGHTLRSLYWHRVPAYLLHMRVVG